MASIAKPSRVFTCSNSVVPSLYWLQRIHLVFRNDAHQLAVSIVEPRLRRRIDVVQLSMKRLSSD